MSLKLPTIMRLVELRNAGLSCAAAAAVVNLDEGRENGDRIGSEQVRAYTRQFGVGPRSTRGGFRVEVAP